MDKNKTIHQLNEEQESRIKERGEANAVRKQTRAIKRGDLSGTDAGLNAAEKARDGVVVAIQEAIAGFMAEKVAKKAKTPPGWLIQLQNNPIEVTAELALRVCLTQLAQISHTATP